MASLTPFLRDAPNECAFQGEPDIYGFGIRLGIYLQWTSVLIVRTFKLRGRASLAKSYVIFIFAIFVALLFMTANATPSTEINKSSEDTPKGPYAVEVMILAYIIFGGVYIVLLTGNDPMPIQRFDVDTVTRLCRQFVFWCVLTAASVYYIWFWLDGINDRGFLETPGGCGTYGFLFAKVSLYNQSVKTFFAFLQTLYVPTLELREAKIPPYSAAMLIKRLHEDQSRAPTTEADEPKPVRDCQATSSSNNQGGGYIRDY
ncbi:hypothetical protein CEP54_004020 [Fusarium duplospermum]|uniref:Uncharacterized protein n=1 Tax=Fusarium duplospermum TaxID=1325734 RepID=A0A428QKW1_9HYPO|nr:hypothetical protein CEP54_004020 [Fusarium duplospermum]